MSDLESFFVFIGAVLTVAWGVALLVGVWKIRAALVDEDYRPLDLVEGGRTFRIRVSRVRGRFGATFQAGESAQPVTVQPTFTSPAEVTAHVRRLVAAS